MAGRFTSAAIVDSGPKIIEGLHTPSTSDPPPPPKKEEQTDEKREDESPKAHAARMGMYGRLTREVKPWTPAKLLCKRFGVKDPNPPAEFDSTADVSVNPTGAAPSQEPDASTVLAAPSIAPDASFASSLAGKRDLVNIGLGEDENQGRDTLTYERPAMDIFKAIFASDDEDSGDEDVKVEKEDDMVPSTSTTASITKPTVEAEPKDNPTPVPVSEEKVDIGTFKPTFIPRSDRLPKDVKEKKEKQEKKKSGKAVLMSFELDEDGSAPSITPKKKDKDRPKKKKKKDRPRAQQAEDEDDGMWIEKPPPDVVKDLSAPLQDKVEVFDQMESLVGPPRGRKRAIDFM
jgi:G patch domain-containing protein 1